MNTLQDKHILLGISGGIAAYKCAELIRRLRERGAEVRVVMTTAAQEFITPLTLQAVSGFPVANSLLDPAAEASMGHIELAKWADIVLIAPATADLIARMSAGMGNDLLTTIYLATAAPVAIAPAMNQQMYRHPATQANLHTLAERQVTIWGPAIGSQACGDTGPGRMLEPMELVECLEKQFIRADLNNLNITITAGPTQEALDPVRFLSNHSSGKMGYAIAQAALERGANVTLISGPVKLTPPKQANTINVVSAINMHEAALSVAPKSDIFIACAAVADYRAAEIQVQKIKKTIDNNKLTLSLVKNPDIVASVAALVDKRPFTVGFAAETQNVADYAKQKRQRKRLDMICANNVSDPNLGFNSDDNALTLYWENGELALSKANKHTLAHQLLTQIATRYKESK